MNILKNLKFWKKFSYFLLIGIASLFILAGGQEIVINSAQLARAENPIPIPPPPPPPACTETPRDFPQCGGTAGLEGRDPTHTFIVREFTNSCTQAKRFEVVEDKGNLGQCQVAPPPPASPQPPVQPVRPVCNDAAVALIISPAAVNSGNRINFAISGDASTHINDDFSGAVFNCSGPWNSQTCTADGPGTFTWTHSWRRCEGDINNCSDVCVKRQQFRIAAVVVPTPTPRPTPIPTPIPTPTPPAPPQGGVNCSPGFVPVLQNGQVICMIITNNNNNSNTNNNVNNNNNNINFGNVGVGAAQPAVVRAAVVQPQVVTQLPKTGLPLLAWSALAFVPAGLGMKRFKKIKKDLLDDPTYIWEDRKFKSES